MKNLWLHSIYLSIIGILGFQLWSKTTVVSASFQQIEEILKNDFYVLKYSSQDLFTEVNKYYNVRPTDSNKNYFIESQEISALSNSEINYIDKRLLDLQTGKNCDFKDFKDSLLKFSQAMLGLDSDIDSSLLHKFYGLNKFVKSDTFQNGFNLNQKTYLIALKNQIKMDEILYLNYYLDKTSSRFCGFIPKFRVGIAPKKATVILGEKFEADVFIGTYSIYITDSTKISVNNENLQIVGGMAHYSKTEKTTGLKTIRLTGAIRNPATGQITTTSSEFEYHVLPKCSENCQ